MSNASVVFEGPTTGRSLSDWSGYLADLLKMAESNPQNDGLMDAIDDAKNEIAFLRSLELNAVAA